MVQQVNSGKNFVTLAPASDGQTVVHILVRDPRERGMYLQAIYLVSDSLNALTTNVRDAYEVYKERAYLRNSIKFSFGLTLSLVLLLGLFAAAWGAFYTSRHMVKPIRDISEGTQAVAAGNYEAQVPNPKVRDELGFLVDSFNQMTRRILQTRNLADESRKELQAQHGYLETILGALSSGVIAVDQQGIIKTANPTAEKILGEKIFFPNGISLNELANNNLQIKPFIESITKNIFDKDGTGSYEITLHREEGRQVLLCRYSKLQINKSQPAGRVLVFDDVTELMRAQKDAAWSEVARRLAHEIKNPLTPIQLAAERMRHKYLDKMDKSEVDVLERATKTIVQQVDALKLMVNEFSDFARPCKMDPRPILIDEFFHDVMALYEDPKGNVIFEPGAENIAIEGDPIRLRQVLHNLIKNGQEALPTVDGKVKVSTSLIDRNGRELLQISVEDNGDGFDPKIIDQVFDPYVTSKSKGTGLGLAIVKRIIGEHGGSIRADNSNQLGARIVIHLPLRSTKNNEINVKNSDWQEGSET
tara:strand:- start:1672 stop:3264 length:1593 start_codon:yes stop_codon:yes gene_type:complete